VRLRGALSFAGNTASWATVPAAMHPASQQNPGRWPSTGSVLTFISTSGLITTQSGTNAVYLDGWTYPVN
jgi:hypothetical protein